MRTAEIVRNTNEKTESIIELILTKDALRPEKENLVSVLDFIGHVSENIENMTVKALPVSEFNEIFAEYDFSWLHLK